MCVGVCLIVCYIADIFVCARVHVVVCDWVCVCMCLFVDFIVCVCEAGNSNVEVMFYVQLFVNETETRVLLQFRAKELHNK